MKKSTLEAIRNYLNGDDTVDLTIVREEVNNEWERLNAKRVANATMYDEAHEVFCSIMSGKRPMTVKDIFTLGADEWPSDFTSSKLGYAIRNYWKDEIVAVDNGRSANEYSLK